MAEKKKKKVLHSQAYLMWLLGQNKSKKRGILTRDEQNSKKFRCTHVKKLTGAYQPESVVNKVNSPPRSSSGDSNLSNSFFNLETHKLSMLVPEIRFYKVDGENLEPFYFPTVSDFDPLANSSERIPGYAGGNSVIQNFSVKLQGTDPFTARKYLEASLVIRVDSLANIFIKKEGYARLGDLFTISTPSSKVYSGSGQTVKAGQLAHPIEILATLGYSVRDPDGVFTMAELREIQDNAMILRMNVGEHTINLGKDGTATINIKYTARISSLEESRASFSLTHGVADIVQEAAIKQKAKDVGGDISQSAEAKAKVDALEQQSMEQKKVSNKIIEIRKITELLEAKGRIFRRVATPTDIEKFQKQITVKADEEPAGVTADSFGSTPSSPAATPEPKSDEKKAKEKAAESIRTIDGPDKSVYFFTFSDMIEAFCKTRITTMKEATKFVNRSINTAMGVKNERVSEINKNIKKLETLQVLLPDIKIVFPHTKPNMPPSPPMTINMGDIPISTDLYQKYIFNEIINTKGDGYSITDFLENCVSVVLPKAIGGFAKKAPNIVTNKGQVFASTTFTGAEVTPTPGSHCEVDIDKIEGPSIVAHRSKGEKEMEYFIIYPEPEPETPSARAGNEQQDFNDNIYHLHLGKDRGIIKDVTFQRFTVPFRQESLMTNQIGLYDELRMPYSANINMFGNTLFYPGCELYIDPYSIGFGDPRDSNSPAADLGLGGYYFVLTVEIKYSGSGKLETRLECSFRSWPKEVQASLEGASISEPPPADATASGAEPASPDSEPSGDGPPVFGESDLDGAVVEGVTAEEERDEPTGRSTPAVSATITHRDGSTRDVVQTAPELAEGGMTSADAPMSIDPTQTQSQKIESQSTVRDRPLLRNPDVPDDYYEDDDQPSPVNLTGLPPMEEGGDDGY